MKRKAVPRKWCYYHLFEGESASEMGSSGEVKIIEGRDSAVESVTTIKKCRMSVGENRQSGTAYVPAC